MKTINFIFRVHNRINLKNYLFFDIGNDHYYYDDYVNQNLVESFSLDCYLAANSRFLDIITNSNGKFKVSFAITGLALEQFEQFAPEVIDSFKKLAKTGCVEFIATPYAHSLSSLFDESEFIRQVKLQASKIEQLFGYKPTTFANSALIYNDEIGETVSKLGFNGVIVEGAKQFLGSKSARNLYNHHYLQNLKLLVRDFKLSDDINYRFSNVNWNEYPLTAEKFVDWIKVSPNGEEVFNVMMGYEALGITNKRHSGIFDFFSALPYHAIANSINFSLPSDVIAKNNSKGSLSAMFNVSWTDEEKDTSAWCANELQKEALDKLYKLTERVNLCSDQILKSDWHRIQDSSHFYFMGTKHYSDGVISEIKSPYTSAYQAFANYMNVLGDFIERVSLQYPSSIEDEELNALLQTINNQELLIAKLEGEIKKLKASRKKEIFLKRQKK